MRLKRRNSRPGLSYIIERLRGIVAPDVAIAEPPGDIRFKQDVEVAMRDGTILRVNVFRPPGDGPFPTIVCAHPYSKDHFSKRTWLGYEPSLQYRIMRQPQRVEHSAFATWESPDPAYWCAHGYAVVNCDLRGFGHSDGVGTLLSDQEAHDYYDLIEWAAAQPWSTGRIGLNGVSYLALSQWRVAALQPPHLAAICPWEGFSDVYRDFARPGGVREDGFLPFWSFMVSRSGRVTENVRAEQVARPLFDDWWKSRCPELERIEVPALICASFSDQALHSRGGFEGFMRIGSKEKWLYTHRGGKWATYYSPEALAVQRRFFDCFLKGEENGMRAVPPVRIEIRSDRDTVREVREESQWPPAGITWTKLYLGENAALSADEVAEGSAQFDAPAGVASFVWRVPNDMRIVGPMALTVAVSLERCDDVSLFAVIRKIAGDANVPFEGSYGFGYDVVAKGSLRLSLRALDTQRSLPWHPVYPFDRFEKIKPGEIVTACIEILPSATFFAAGDALHVDIGAQWLYQLKVPPILGMEYYARSRPAGVTLHFGGATGAHLLVPVL